MKPAATSRLHGLDTLRACAILMVVTYHVQSALPPIFEWSGKIGWMGVDLFFVLSGYLIGRQLLKLYREGAQPALGILLREFYRRRAYRILPAYLAVLALYFLWPAWREADHISPLWEFLTFTENLFVDYARNHAFSHIWSLCVEEHFYLVLPLLVAWMMKRPSLRKTVVVLIAFVAAGIAIRSWELVHVLRVAAQATDTWGVLYFEHIYYPSWCRLDGLIFGVALAATQIFRPAWWAALRRHGHLLTLSGVGLLAFSVRIFWDRTESVYGLAAWSTILGYPLMSLAMALLVASAMSEHGVLQRIGVPGAKLVATLAFGIYLTHKEVVHLDQLWIPWLDDNRSWAAAAVYAASCLCAAGVLYLCVERPFMRLRDRRA